MNKLVIEYQKMNRSHRGFTLIETLVAVTILVSAVTATLYISVQGLILSSASRERLVAAYLAQEPIEFIRSVRDGNMMKNVGWLNGLGACMPGPCRIDMSATPTVAPCGGGNCGVLRLNATTGLYGYASGDPTIYTRSVTIATPVGANVDEARIAVTVSWQGKTGARSFVVEDDIFRW